MRQMLFCIWLCWSTALWAQSTIDTLVVLYTGGSNGYLEACPCSEESLGGLAKRLFVINETRNQHGENVLLLDAGNLFSSYPRNQREEKLLAELIAEMRYDALNIGESDFSYGLNFMRETTAALPMVSASVVDKAQCPIATPYRLKRLAGRRIAVIGLLAESAFQVMQDAAKPDLAVKHAPTALAETMALVRREKPDAIIVLLRSFDVMLEKYIAETYPDIHIVISNAEEFAKNTLVKFGDTIAACAGHDGEYIGKLTLVFSGDRLIPIANHLIPLSPKARADEAMHRKIQAFKQAAKSRVKTKHNINSNGN